MKSYKSFLNEDTYISESSKKPYFGVFATGGSIGDVRGRDEKPVHSFNTKEEAKERAKRLRKTLTPGEKSYYKMGYVVKPTEYSPDDISKMYISEADISGSKISMLGSKVFNKIKIGSKFNTDTNVYTVKDFGRASNAFKEYIVTDKNGKDIGAKLSAMYSTTFALSDDPRSLVFRKEEMLNSITI